MRPVARIAQSVEQGIENPRVLGSIPSPGTTYSENPAYGWVFAFLQPDSPSNCVRLFAATRLTPSGPARQARCSTPAALVRVRAPLIQRTQPMAGFLLFCNRTLHRTTFDYSPPRGSPLRGQRDKRAVQRRLQTRRPDKRSAIRRNADIEIPGLYR